MRLGSRARGEGEAHPNPEPNQASSTLLATSFGLSGEALNKELQSRFERADVDKNGTLDFHEFQAP